VRGKYLAQYRSGTNLVLPDADAAKAYPTAEAVNEALRRLMQLQEADLQRLHLTPHGPLFRRLRALRAAPRKDEGFFLDTLPAS
jgi:hypothetical protein